MARRTIPTPPRALTHAQVMGLAWIVLLLCSGCVRWGFDPEADPDGSVADRGTAETATDGNASDQSIADGGLDAEGPVHDGAWDALSLDLPSPADGPQTDVATSPDLPWPADAAVSPDLPWPADATSQDMPLPPTGVVWAQGLGDPSQQVARAIAADSSGNIYLTGHFYGSVDFGNGAPRISAGGADIFVASYTSAGTFRWVKSFGGSSFDQGNAIAVDSAGNVTITGEFQSASIDPGGGPLSNADTSAQTTDILIASYSSSGSFRWAHRYGGSNNDRGNGVAVDPAGNVYLLGEFFYDVDFGGGVIKGDVNSGDMVVASYTSAGAHRWSEGHGWAFDEQAAGIAVDASSNVYITGATLGFVNFGCGQTGTHVSWWVFLVSFTGSTGACRWANTLDGSDHDVGRAVAVDPAGNVTVTGGFTGTADFGGGPLTASGPSDIVLASFDSATGSYRWAQMLGGTVGEDGYDVAADSSGNTYLVGSFSGTADFGGTTLTSAGESDIFVYSTTAAGAMRWVKQMGGPETDEAYGVTVSGNNLFATGTFEGTANFGAALLTSAGASDIFLIKLQP